MAFVISFYYCHTFPIALLLFSPPLKLTQRATLVGKSLVEFDWLQNIPIYIYFHHSLTGTHSLTGMIIAYVQGKSLHTCVSEWRALRSHSDNKTVHRLVRQTATCVSCTARSPVIFFHMPHFYAQWIYKCDASYLSHWEVSDLACQWLCLCLCSILHFACTWWVSHFLEWRRHSSDRKSVV